MGDPAWRGGREFHSLAEARGGLEAAGWSRLGGGGEGSRRGRDHGGPLTAGGDPESGEKEDGEAGLHHWGCP